MPLTLIGGPLRGETGGSGDGVEWFDAREEPGGGRGTDMAASRLEGIGDSWGGVEA